MLTAPRTMMIAAIAAVLALAPSVAMSAPVPTQGPELGAPRRAATEVAVLRAGCETEPGIAPGHYSGGVTVQEDRTALEVPPGGVGVYAFFEVSLDVFEDGSVSGSTNVSWRSHVLAEPTPIGPSTVIVAVSTFLDVTASSFSGTINPRVGLENMPVDYREAGRAYECYNDKCNFPSAAETYDSATRLTISALQPCGTSIYLDVTPVRFAGLLSTWNVRYGIGPGSSRLRLDMAPADVQRMEDVLADVRRRVAELRTLDIGDPLSHGPSEQLVADLRRAADGNRCAEILARNGIVKFYERMIGVDIDVFDVDAHTAPVGSVRWALVTNMKTHILPHDRTLTFLSCQPMPLNELSAPLAFAADRVLEAQRFGDTLVLSALHLKLFGTVGLTPAIAVRVATRTYRAMTANWAAATRGGRLALGATAVVAENILNMATLGSVHQARDWYVSHQADVTGASS